MKHRLRPAAALLILAAAITAGCGQKPPVAPPSQDTIVKRLQDNPNLTPEMRQAALENMRTHQMAGRIRGQVMQRAQAGH